MKRDLRTILVILMSVSLMMLAGCGGGSTEPEPEEPETTKVEGIGIHHAEIDIADYGTVSVELDGDTAPITVRQIFYR